MALLCSRTYLGTVLKQGIVATRVPGLSFLPHTLLRRNASTATKLKATPKTTGKASPKATRKKNSPSSPAQKKPTPATSKTVSGTQAPKQNAAVEEKTTDADAAKAMSEEEMEKELQRMMQMSELMPTMDFFGQEIHSTLGVFRKQSR